MIDSEKLKEAVQIANRQWTSLEQEVIKDAFSKPLEGYKNCLKLAYSALCTTHAENSARLFNDGVFSSAKALMRPCLDAYGRQLIVTYAFDDLRCEEVWKKMQALAEASRRGAHKEAVDIERSVGLRFGEKITDQLRDVDIPAELPKFEQLAKAFSHLNGYVHGGVGLIGILLSSGTGFVAEPEFGVDHVQNQIALIEIRSMSIAALLFSEKKNEDGVLVLNASRAITAGVKKLVHT